MKINATENQIEITDFFNSISLVTREGKKLHICLRDYGFEMKLESGDWHLIQDESDFKIKEPILGNVSNVSESPTVTPNTNNNQ